MGWGAASTSEWNVARQLLELAWYSAFRHSSFHVQIALLNVYAAHELDLLKHFWYYLDLSTTITDSIQRLPSPCCSVCNHIPLPCPACALKCTPYGPSAYSLFLHFCVCNARESVCLYTVRSAAGADRLCCLCKASSLNTPSFIAHTTPKRCAMCTAEDGGLLFRGAVSLAQRPAQQRHPLHNTRPASAASATTKAQIGTRPLPTQHPGAGPQRRTEE